MFRHIQVAAGLFLLASPQVLRAQPEGRTDVAISYLAERSLQANTAYNFWSQGGSVEIGAVAFHGFGVAANVSGVHTGAVGAGGVPLSMVSATFGPRYRWHSRRRVSLYGEALLGEAEGFRSLFPSTSGGDDSASSLALQFGGGVDLKVSQHFALRPFEASWLRTQFPNGTNNRQNSLQLGAGVVVRFGF